MIASRIPARLGRLRERTFTSRLAESSKRLALLLAIVVLVGSGLVGTLSAMHGGGSFSIVLAIAIVLSPILVLVGWRAPVIFPYGLYLTLVPFENLLTIGGVGTISRFLGVLSAAAMLVGMVKRSTAVPLPKTWLWWTALCVWMIASLGWTLDLQAGVQDTLQMIGFVVVYFVIAAYPTTKRDFAAVAAIVATSGLIASLYGIWLFRHDAYLVTEGRLFISVGSSNIDPNHFADALLLPAIFWTMATLQITNLCAKAVAALGLAVVLGGIYVTLSREAFLAYGVALVVLLVRSRYRRQVLAIIAAAVFALALQGAEVGARFGSSLQTGGAGRVAIWRVGATAFSRHWLRGSGVGSAIPAYDDAYLDVAQHYSGGWSRPSHDLLIHYGIELGIFGAALVVWLWLSQLRLLRMIGTVSRYRNGRNALEAALAALFVASLFIDLFGYKYVWIAFAMIVQLRAVALRDPETAFPMQTEEPRPMNYFARNGS